MDNVTFIQIENNDGSIDEVAIIDRGNGEYTSMAKSVYDAMNKVEPTWTEPTLTKF